MKRAGRHWSALAWVACVAVLLNAFAPIVSHALRAGARVTMEMEVCTALGMEKMPVTLVTGQPDQPASDKLHKGMTHCGYCAVHAGSFGHPPPMAAQFALLEGRNAYPSLYYHAPRPLFAWSLRQPRAPPALS